MIKQKKKYSRPQRPFDKARIDEENILREKYGLKNKKEIWKADASVGRIRNLAKTLITASDEEREAFIGRLHSKGFKVEKIADVLALNKEDWLKRRLQTILFSKGITSTPKQARQLIAHKHVSIGDQIVNVPSYMVTLEEEPMVKLNIVLKTESKKSKEAEIKEDIAKGVEEKDDEQIMNSKEGIKNVEEDASSEESDEKLEVVEEVPTEDKKEVVEDTEDKSEEKTE